LPDSIFEKAEEAAFAIRKQIPASPRVAIVLGSGLGAFADRIEQPVAILIRRFPTFLGPQSKAIADAS